MNDHGENQHEILVPGERVDKDSGTIKITLFLKRGVVSKRESIVKLYAFVEGIRSQDQRSSSVFFCFPNVHHDLYRKFVNISADGYDYRFALAAILGGGSGKIKVHDTSKQNYTIYNVEGVQFTSYSTSTKEWTDVNDEDFMIPETLGIDQQTSEIEQRIVYIESFLSNRFG